MKILYVAPDFPGEPVNGCHWFAHTLINGMARSHECDLLSPGRPDQEPGARAWEARVPGLRVLDLFTLGQPRLFRAAKAANYVLGLRVTRLVRRTTPEFERAIACALRSTSYDVVHFTDLSLFYLRPLVAGLPTVISGPDPFSLHLRSNLLFETSRWERLKLGLRTRGYTKVERVHLAGFSAVHVVSATDADRLRRAAGLDNVCAINLAVDPWFLTTPVERRPPDGGVCLFSSGRFQVPSIRVPFMRFFDGHWEAIRRAHSGTRWVVVGSGAPADVKRRLRETGGVEYHDGTPDYNGLLVGSDIAVFLDGSGTGMKTRVLQAMAAGKPVVGPEVVFGEIGVVDGVHAFVANDGETVAGVVARLVESPELRYRVGRAARELISTRFTQEATSRDWEALYTRVSGQSAPAARERAARLS